MASPIVRTGPVEWFICGLGNDHVVVSYAIAPGYWMSDMKMTPNEAEQLGQLLIAAAKHARTQPAIGE